MFQNENGIVRSNTKIKSTPKLRELNLDANLEISTENILDTQGLEPTPNPTPTPPALPPTPPTRAPIHANSIRTLSPLSHQNTASAIPHYIPARSPAS